MNPKNINSYHFFEDYKAEIMAAEIVERGFPEDRVIINILGAFKRTYRKDIETIVGDETDYEGYIQIDSHRGGIYDSLPEGLFHQLGVKEQPETKEEIIRLMRERKAEEAAARRFFIPFESALNHLRMQLALYEIKLDKSAHYTDLSEIFQNEWSIFEYLDAAQATIFIQLLPIIHEIRDNYPIAEAVFQLILMVPITIKSQRRKPMVLDEPIICALGDNGLGIDFTTGNSLFDDGENELIISLGPMSKKQLAQFLPGSINRNILDALCDYLLPIHLDTTIDFDLLPEDKIFEMGEDSFNDVMGFSAYL